MSTLACKKYHGASARDPCDSSPTSRIDTVHCGSRHSDTLSNGSCWLSSEAAAIETHCFPKEPRTHHKTGLFQDIESCFYLN